MKLSVVVAASPFVLLAFQYGFRSGHLTTVMFGGDTWIWDGVNWTMYHPAVSPPARNTQGMAYAPFAKRILMFGGSSNAGGVLNVTWEWDGTTKIWKQLFPAVLYGGDSATGDCCDTHYTDTWKWNGKTWTQQFPVSSPPARALPALAYDAALEKLVMFGGYLTPGEGLNDSWSWDGTTWTQSQTTFSPPGRWAAGVAYDAAIKSIVLFGGEVYRRSRRERHLARGSISHLSYNGESRVTTGENWGWHFIRPQQFKPGIGGSQALPPVLFHGIAKFVCASTLWLGLDRQWIADCTCQSHRSSRIQSSRRWK